MAKQVDGAASHVATGLVTLNDTTPTKIVDARAGRRKLLLFGGSGIKIGDSAVTPSTAYTIASGLSAEVVLETAAEVWGLSVAVSNSVMFLEIYD